MRTHEHREGSTKHWGLLGEKGRASGRGWWGGIAWGEMPNVGEGEKERKAHCQCVPTQLSYMLCSCTPKPKIQ